MNTEKSTLFLNEKQKKHYTKNELIAFTLDFVLHTHRSTNYKHRQVQLDLQTQTNIKSNENKTKVSYNESMSSKFLDTFDIRLCQHSLFDH